VGLPKRSSLAWLGARAVAEHALTRNFGLGREKASSGPARPLFILSPAGMEGLIKEMGEPARSLTVPPPPEEPPDEAEMGRLMGMSRQIR
jgi:hypothetical protein